MLNEFKNLELLRHQVSSRFDKSLQLSSMQNRNNAEKILSAIFSASCSLLIAFLSHSYIEQDKVDKAVLCFVAFIVVYITAYFLSKCASKLVTKISYNIKRHGAKLSEIEVKELVDNFDHIACDNNLVGKRCIQAIGHETDKSIKEDVFYEVYYYVKVEADITSSILENSDACVNTLTKSTRVSLPRLYNQVRMMKCATEFMLEHIGDSDLEILYNLKLVIISDIVSLSAQLSEIESACDNFVEQNFSDTQVEDLKKYMDIISKIKIIENNGLRVEALSEAPVTGVCNRWTCESA